MCILPEYLFVHYKFGPNASYVYRVSSRRWLSLLSILCSFFPCCRSCCCFDLLFHINSYAYQTGKIIKIMNAPRLFTLSRDSDLKYTLFHCLPHTNIVLLLYNLISPMRVRISSTKEWTTKKQHSRNNNNSSGNIFRCAPRMALCAREWFFFSL